MGISEIVADLRNRILVLEKKEKKRLIVTTLLVGIVLAKTLTRA